MRSPTPVARANRRPLFVAGGAILFALIAGGAAAGFYTEVLWFREIDYERIFWTGLRTQLALGGAFGLVFTLFLLLNLWVVRAITNPARLFSVPDHVLERYRTTLRPYTKWIVIGTALLFGLFAGSGASVQWRDWLLFNNSVSFGEVDPVFGRDLSFYVFRLPFHQFLFTWAFSTLVVTTLVVGGAHYLMGGIRPQVRSDPVAPEVRAHLSVLLGLIVLLKAWGYRLDQFNLLYSSRGTVTGASYTDVNAQLPALRLLVVIAIITSLFFLINARFRNWILPLGGIALLALTSVVAGGIYPAAVQRLRVTPNERLRERPFIERNIEATRRAFGLADVEQATLSGTADLSPSVVRQHQRTIENIRLWDPEVLKRVYVSIQRIKQYYEFLDVDVDRYQFADGSTRQVMLSAREIFPQGLSANAQTWLNTHLVYTHGYGVVASRVDRVTSEGQPSFIVRDIPPKPLPGGPAVTQPRIYYGEYDPTAFAVVNSEQQELDFPQGDKFAENRYDGKGGVRLSGVVRRAAFAWRFRDVNLLISGAVRPQSRIIFRRNVAERVARVAPFLRLDNDPYVAIVNGRTVWVIDAYTTSSMLPYAERMSFTDVARNLGLGSGNYIRNSVKFVVDAADGTVTGYRWDESDPILRAWMKVFPGLLKPKSEMSPALLEHVRYPEDLFEIQTDRYATYHITNPDNFYSKEDAWLVANDPTSEGLVPQPMPAYYVLMRLPGEDADDLDFVLVRPFTPLGRQNMTGYMVAHGDPDEYGRLVTYVFPRSDAIFGPEQIQQRINQDTLVSQQKTLWDQAGSQVIHGNLLVIPIEQSLLYVQPLYLQGQGGSGGRFPELKRVVAVSGERVVMANTLTEALGAMFGREVDLDLPEQAPPAQADIRALLAQALRHDERAQECLRQGDFACYGREQEAERRVLERAARAAGASPAASPRARS